MANNIFPGRPDYVGPNIGFFGILHHDVLFEQSNNVRGRVANVRRDKPASERATRLYNMIYLGAIAPTMSLFYTLEIHYANELCEAMVRRDIAQAAVLARRAEELGALAQTQIWEEDEIIAKYQPELRDLDGKLDLEVLELYRKQEAEESRLEGLVLAYIREQIPDCAWDAQNGKLVFPEWRA